MVFYNTNYCKAFAKYSQKINLNFLSIEPIELNLSFPFSWYLIFIAGELFIVSNLIYQAACPNIIREFRNFSEFITAGYPNSYIIAQGQHHKFEKEELDKLINSSPERQQMLRTEKPPDFELEYNLRNAQKELFDKIYIKANESKKLVRYLATIIIISAVLLFAFIIYQNIDSVIKIYEAT